MLLIAGHHKHLEEFERIAGFDQFRYVPRSDLIDVYHLHERLMVMRISTKLGCWLENLLKESRMGDALGSRVLGILRGNDPILMPEPWETLQANDSLVVEGRMSDFEILHGLEELEIERRTQPDLHTLVSGNIGLLEAILSPHTTLVWKDTAPA